MKFLSRLVMVLVFLGGLAYGSYAVGKYILSNRLFGNTMSSSRSRLGAASIQSRVAPSVTRRTSIKGNKPRVEMEVLPAQEAGPGPELPTISTLERITAQKNHASSSVTSIPALSTTRNNSSGAGRSSLGTRRFDSPSAASSRSREGRVSSGSNEEERPRRRRRRRRSSSETTTQSRTSYTRSAGTARAENRYSSGTSRRNSQSGEATTRREYSSGRSRSRRDSDRSPVPQAEGSYTSRRRGVTSESYGGRSESPVPMPE